MQEILGFSKTYEEGSQLQEINQAQGTSITQWTGAEQV